MNTRIRRKESAAVCAGRLLFVLLSVAPLLAGPQGGITLTGEITDERLNCVQTPMNAVEGIKDKVECVLYWTRYVRPANKYVLYDPATKTTYQLSDQNVVAFAGRRVEVNGTLDADKTTIKVNTIKIVR